MPFEFDMLAVGNADAIVLRCTNEDEETVVLIDAGKAGNSDEIISHIETWTDSQKIDLLISTHPHDDHMGGLPTVIKAIPVSYALIHEPSTFNEQIKAFRPFVTSEQLQKAQKSYEDLTGMISLLDRLKIPRIQPFTGFSCKLSSNTSLAIVGPTEEFYSRYAPEIAARIKEAKSIDLDRLVVDADDDADPFNSSSVITLVQYEDTKYLFTADASPLSFNNAIENNAELLADIHWMQIPHHGSKRNVTSDLIQYFSPKTAYVSAKGSSDKNHPSAEVIRLFQAENCRVFGTNKSGGLHHRNGGTSRSGYVTATPLDANAQ